jgi:putative endonuclease
VRFFSASNHEGVALCCNPRHTSPMHAYVYILLCADDSYYVGSTQKEPEQRTWEHNERLVEGYTSKRTPVKLMAAERYERLVDAFAREQQVKKWSRRKKEALIRGDYEALPDLASRPKRT